MRTAIQTGRVFEPRACAGWAIGRTLHDKNAGEPMYAMKESLLLWGLRIFFAGCYNIYGRRAFLPRKRGKGNFGTGQKDGASDLGTRHADG